MPFAVPGCYNIGMALAMEERAFIHLRLYRVQSFVSESCVETTRYERATLIVAEGICPWVSRSSHEHRRCWCRPYWESRD